jgi:hypothetical protein
VVVSALVYPVTVTPAGFCSDTVTGLSATVPDVHSTVAVTFAELSSGVKSACTVNVAGGGAVAADNPAGGGVDVVDADVGGDVVGGVVVGGDVVVGAVVAVVVVASLGVDPSV